MAAIDHLFSDRPEIRKIDDSTNLFRDVREAIAAQALAGQGLSLEEAKTEMGYTVPDSSMESWGVNLWELAWNFNSIIPVRPDAALNLIKAAHFYRLKMYYPVLFLFLLQSSPKRDFWRLVH